ncbi:protein kinase domain-containing protein [Cryptosporidium muris RN66]|uniref:Protein kinase domain-containing protein n=1 Tax=Cryptosporidium muris (strain RN66) TaxID=441375 RepID=B6AI50_CRYMR|nr:protein kinase domain-containing protein [Cryptosporidium muris RN66]EEA07891.1 protein kinase domain-containing protein [Cryptosporidium muris RN66]|eukprot:XP_002142240.1 protein kinase domain-containing protein [Cryptosporidium muris RN66]
MNDTSNNMNSELGESRGGYYTARRGDVKKLTQVLGNEKAAQAVIWKKNTSSAYCNENMKSNGEMQVKSQKSDHEGAFTLKTIANNFMSFFGYGSEQESGKSNPSDIKIQVRRQQQKKSTLTSRSLVSVAVATDVEDNGCKDYRDNNRRKIKDNLYCKSSRDNISSQTNFNDLYIDIDKHVEVVNDRLDELSNLKTIQHFGSNVNYKKVSSNKPIVAHISGKPVHAKYIINKDNLSMARVSNAPLFTPSPTLQYRNIAPTPIVYNTPLITHRVVPHILPETSNSKKGHVRQKTIYSHENLPVQKNVFIPSIHQSQYIQSQTPLVTYRGFNYDKQSCSMEALPVMNHSKTEYSIPYIETNSDGDLTITQGELSSLGNSNNTLKLDKNPDENLNYPEVMKYKVCNSSENKINHENLNKTINNTILTAGNNKTVNNIKDVKIDKNNKIIRDGKITCNDSGEMGIVHFDASGNFRITSNAKKAVSLEEFSHVQNVRTSSSSIKAGNTQENGDLSSYKNCIKTTIDDLTYRSDVSEKKKDGSKVTNMFIPQASPIINCRSTLDYLVTPMVRYRDINNSSKVYTIPPQLQRSNEAVNLNEVGNSLNNTKYINNSSHYNTLNSDVNSSIYQFTNQHYFMNPNECYEVVYTPVAPLLIIPHSGNNNLFSCENSNPCQVMGDLTGNHLMNSGVGFVPDDLSLQNELNKLGSSVEVTNQVSCGISNNVNNGPQSNSKTTTCTSTGSNNVPNSSLNNQQIPAIILTTNNTSQKVVGCMKPEGVVYRNLNCVVNGINSKAANVGKKSTKDYQTNIELGTGGHQNRQKVYVRRMHQYLADPRNFPVLPKELSINDIRFLTKISNNNQNVKNINRSSIDETNVTKIKGSELRPGMEWDNINRGTFCTVYKAEYNKEIVAVKCPQRKLHNADPLMSRYRCYIEWKLLDRCNCHPNILNLIGGIRLDEYEIWLVTEYVKTGDLFKLIHGSNQRSKILMENSEYKFKVIYQLADAIRFLHSLSPKIVHKDLKSNNILVDEDFNIRICDFGDAEELHYNTITCCTAVTWQYAPPEIVGCSDPARPNTNANEKVDVWSMGCIFLEILCKRTPLQHILDNILDTSKHHSALYRIIHSNKIEQELKIPPLPDILYNLITMCLRSNPNIRASSQEVFDYLVNNKDKIKKQLNYLSQYKLYNSGNSLKSNQNVLIKNIDNIHITKRSSRRDYGVI